MIERIKLWLSRKMNCYTWALICSLFLAMGYLFGSYSCPHISPQLLFLIKKIAKECSLDPDLVRAIVICESKGNPSSMSSKGAIGLMQLMPSTARLIAKRSGLTVDNMVLTEPETNIKLGCLYFHWLLMKFHGSFELALAAYNAGPARVMAWTKIDVSHTPQQIIYENASKETYFFVRKVLARYRLLKRKK